MPIKFPSSCTHKDSTATSFFYKFFSATIIIFCLTLASHACLWADSINILPATDRTGERSSDTWTIYQEDTPDLFATFTPGPPLFERRSVLEFNLSDIPSDAAVTSARLQLHVSSATPDNAVMVIRYYIGEGTITSDDMDCLTPLQSTAVPVTSPGEYSVDVTMLVQAAHYNSGMFAGFSIIYDSATQGEIAIASKENLPFSPVLIVDYDVAASPVPGFALTHDHIMSEFAFGGGWYTGSVVGQEDVALHACDGGIDHAQLLTSRVPLHKCPGTDDLRLKAITWIIDENINKFMATGDKLYHGKRKEGFPSYSGWPRWDSFAHIQYWEGWLRKAHDDGMTLIVMSAVSFKFLCDLLPPENREFGCDEMESVDRQLQAAIDFANTHSDWVEIALSPADARRIINAGKLAMVLHIEDSDIFGFADDLPQQVEKYYNMGVRSFQLIHQLDNRFAGTAHHSPVFFLAQYLRNCPPGATWCESCRVTTECKDLFNVRIGGLEYHLPILGFDLDADCKNKKGLTDEGRWLIEEMIRRKVLIDMAHLSEKAMNDVYAISQAHDYYPLYISHGHFRPIMRPEKQLEEKTTSTDAIDMIRITGGVFGLRTNPEETKEYIRAGVDNACHGSSRSFTQAYELGRQGMLVDMALAPDMQGFAAQTRPRYGLLGACSAAGVLEERICQRRRENSRPFNGTNTEFDTKGFAHIGLVGDVLQQQRIFGVNVSNLENSAENFIRMWERAQNPTGPVSLQTRDPDSIEPSIRYLSEDERKGFMHQASFKCVLELNYTPWEIFGCRLICLSEKKVCKKSCRTEFGECKDECRIIKGECKEDCKDVREACLNGCESLSGSAKRKCKRDCREAKRECTHTCREDKKECKKVCKEDKTICKTECKTKQEDCRVLCPSDFENCKCNRYFDLIQ